MDYNISESGGQYTTCFNDFDHVFAMQIPVNQVQTYGGLRDVLMKRIFLSALHFRINTRYKVCSVITVSCKIW